MNNLYLFIYIYTLSGRTGSSKLAWHTQGRVFSSRWLKVLRFVARILHRAIHGAQGVLLCVGWDVTASQLDVPSLTSLSSHARHDPCGRLQLDAPHWATSVALLQVVN